MQNREQERQRVNPPAAGWSWRLLITVSGLVAVAALAWKKVLETAEQVTAKPSPSPSQSNTLPRAAVTGVVDDVPPYTGIVPSGATTDDTHLSVIGTVAGLRGPGQVRVCDGPTFLGTAVVSGTTWSYTDTRDLTHGQEVNYKAVVADSKGRSTESKAWEVEVDTQAPALKAEVTGIVDNVGPYTGILPPGATTGLSVKGTLEGTLDKRDVVYVFDGPILLGKAVVSGKTWSYADTRVLPHGQLVSYSARVVDAAGNRSPAGRPYVAVISEKASQPRHFSQVQTSNATSLEPKSNATSLLPGRGPVRY